VVERLFSGIVAAARAGGICCIWARIDDSRAPPGCQTIEVLDEAGPTRQQIAAVFPRIGRPPP